MQSLGIVILQERRVGRGIVKKLVTVFVMVSILSVVVSALEPLVYTDRFGNQLQVVQVSPDCVYSSGDNNHIVVELSESFGGDGKCYGYMFAKSTVIVTVDGLGTRLEGERKIVDVNSVQISYNRETTEILSVAWSDKKDAYLLTFKEGEQVHAEWLNFRSLVFEEMIWLEHFNGSMSGVQSRRVLVVNNNTTGIEFRGEIRKK